MLPTASNRDTVDRAPLRDLNLEGYRWLFDGLPERALIIGDRCEIADANPALLEELDQTRDAVAGRPCHELTPFCGQPCDSSNNPCPGKRALDSGLRFSEIRAYRDEAGARHYVEVTASPLRDADGAIRGVLETRRDINAKRHLENTLTAIYHLGQELVLTRDETQIARAVVNATRQTLNFQICALLLIENGDLCIAASAGYGTPVEHIRLPINGDQGITVAVVQSGKPLYVADVSVDNRFFATKGFEIRSELAVPLKVGDQIIGVLNVESDRLDAFDAIDQQLLATLADVAAVALESARAYRAEQQRASELAALHVLGLALVTEHDPAAIANRIFVELGDLLGIETAVVSILNQSFEELVLYGVDKGQPIPLQKLPLNGVSLSSHVVRTGQPLLISDIGQDDLPVPGVQYGDRTSSWLGVPLRVEDRIIGLINIQSYTANVFGPAEARLLTQIAAQVAPVLENAWLYQQTRQRMSELETLFSVTASVSSDLALDHLLPILVEKLAAATGVASCVISEWDPKARTVTPIVQHTEPDRMPAGSDSLELGVPRYLDELPATEVALLSQDSMVVYAHDQTSDPIEQSRLKERGWASMLALPMMAQGHVLGLVQLYDERPERQYIERDIGLTRTMANQAAVAIQRAKLFQAERQQRQEAEALRQASLVLGATLDTDQVLETLLDQIGRVIPYDAANIMWIENGNIEIIHQRGYERPETAGVSADLHVPLSTIPILERMWTGRAPYIVPDTQDDPEWVEMPFGGWIRSSAGSPIVIRDQVVGFFSLDSRTPEFYKAEHASLLTAFANHAAVAIENARLYQVELQRRQEMAAINRITRGLASGLGFAHLFDSLVRDLGTLVHFDRASVALVDDPQMPKTFRMHAIHDGPNAPLNAGTLMPIASSAASEDVLNGRPHLTVDLVAEADYPAEHFLYESGLRSRVNLPLHAGGRIIGALNLSSRELDAYQPSQLPILQQIADAVAAAIENAQLYQALQEHAAQLEDQVRSRTAELQAERDRTQAILDSAAEGVIVTDLSGNIEYMNPAAEELTGFSRNEAVGQNASLWQSGHTPSEVYQEMWQTILTGGIWEGELLNRRRGGSCYDALLTIAPIPGPSGEPIGFVGMQQDISERKELDRLKDLFVSNVSHELRTPLTNLKLYLKLMEKGRPDKRTQYMATLDREANRLQQLIEDLLSLSRLDVGKAQPIRAETDLNRLVSQLVSDRAALAGEKGLSLTTDLAPGLVPVMADEKMLAQVLTNLTTNAMNYTSAGGRIVVRTALQSTDGAHPANWVTVSVIDTGYGVMPEEKQHLFDRFYRGEAARRAGAPGTGLGLAICREIIDRHDGHITVESELGKGSTFTVWLPPHVPSD
jgi:PAS domain S-box-containing protein